MLTNQLDLTRIERLITIGVDLSYWKLICKTLRIKLTSGDMDQLC